MNVEITSLLDYSLRLTLGMAMRMRIGCLSKICAAYIRRIWLQECIAPIVDRSTRTIQGPIYLHIAQYIRRIFRIGILSASAWPSLVLTLGWAGIILLSNVWKSHEKLKIIFFWLLWIRVNESQNKRIRYFSVKKAPTWRHCEASSFEYSPPDFWLLFVRTTMTN